MLTSPTLGDSRRRKASISQFQFSWAHVPSASPASRPASALSAPMKIAQGSILMSIVITGIPSIRSHVAEPLASSTGNWMTPSTPCVTKLRRFACTFCWSRSLSATIELETALGRHVFEALPDLNSERELLGDVCEPDLETLAGLTLADLGSAVASVSAGASVVAAGAPVSAAVVAGVVAAGSSSPPPHAAAARTTTAAAATRRAFPCRSLVECMASSSWVALRFRKRFRNVQQTIPES